MLHSTYIQLCLTISISQLRWPFSRLIKYSFGDFLSKIIETRFKHLHRDCPHITYYRMGESRPDLLKYYIGGRVVIS